MKLVLAMAMGALTLGVASAKSNSDFNSFMKAMVPKVEKAFTSKDAAFFDSISSADFVDISMGQKLNQKQAMDEMKTSFKATKSMKMTMKLMNTKVSGNTGTAVVSGTATFAMPPGKDGKAHVMAMNFTENQTWVRTGSTWKLKVLEEKMNGGTMDGKPMPKGPGG